MADAKFTPAPWSAAVPIDANYAPMVFTSDGGDPLDAGTLVGGNTEVIANARLIAAAPELYASLIELLEPLERASAELVAHGKVADENAEAAFDRARAALAKALGQ